MAEIEVTVQSILPSDEPQGRFRMRIDADSTVEALLRALCREANTPLRPDYCLRSKGHDLLERRDTLIQSGIQDGAFLHWTCEAQGTEVKTRRCNTFLFLALVSFIIGVVGIVAICTIRYKDTETVTDYAVVFDAGSTHTAMFIYKWEGSKLNGTAVAVQTGNKCTAKGHGIAEFASNPQEAGPSLQSCIDEAKKTIPKTKHGETPIYLGATAGMRLLNEKNATVAEEILTSVRSQFASSGFKFTLPEVSARIISGSDEGTFSWVTSNYVTNAFKVKRPVVQGLIAPTIVPSIGAMDLGGASTQITFVPEDSSVVPAEFKKTLSLFGHNYTIYTHSYLCYGVKEMTNRVLAALVQQQGDNSTEIEHPCLPSGYNLTETYQDLVSSPCVSGEAGLQAFGFNVLQDLQVPLNHSYTFIGQSDGSSCQSFVNSSLFNFTSCPYSQCSFNGVYQPPVAGPFYAFSSFYYVSDFLNLTEGSRTSYNHSDLLNKTRQLCSLDWAQVQLIPASGPEEANLMWYCLQANYINLLVYGGYAFTDATWLGINFVSKVSSTEVGWTLGFVLNESINYPAQYPAPTLYTVTFALLMVLFGLFVVVSIGLAIQGKRLRNSKDVKYRRMSAYGAI